jgi:integrase
LTKDPEEIEELISDYLIHLKDNRHLKAPSINLAKSAIIHFFKRNRIRLNKDWISGFIPTDENYRKDRPYTHDEILKLIEACPEDRIRVAIYLMSSTAMRVGALTYKTPEDKPATLEYRDLTLIPEHKLYKIDVYSRSKNHSYTTYCSIECAAMINRYLDYRRECGEIITETSPLIREQFDRSDSLAVSNPRKIMETTLTKILRLTIKKAGLQSTIAHTVKATHGFRKFAITTMVKAGVKDSYRRYLTGHAQVGQDASYVLPSDEDLLTEYLKCVDSLTISNERRLKKQIEVKDEIHSRDFKYLKRQSQLYQARAWEVLVEKGNLPKEARDELLQMVANLRNDPDENG